MALLGYHLQFHYFLVAQQVILVVAFGFLLQNFGRWRRPMNDTLSFCECRLSAEVVGTLTPYLLTPEPPSGNFQCLIFWIVILVEKTEYLQKYTQLPFYSHTYGHQNIYLLIRRQKTLIHCQLLNSWFRNGNVQGLWFESHQCSFTTVFASIHSHSK